MSTNMTPSKVKLTFKPIIREAHADSLVSDDKGARTDPNDTQDKYFVRFLKNRVKESLV